MHWCPFRLGITLTWGTVPKKGSLHVRISKVGMKSWMVSREVPTMGPV